mgnify:FL=1
MEKAKNKIDMLNGSLWNKILLFAIPIAASNILQQLFNSADAAVVGRFSGSQALAAVGSNGPIINIIISLFVGISLGANVVIANLIGAGKKQQIQNAVHTTITFALIAGFALIFIGWFIAKPFLEFIETPEDVINLAALYLRIYFMGMPFFMLYNFGSSILRSKGDTKRPLFALIISGIINVLLNLLLVIVFKLGVAGVAISTVIATGASSFLVISFLIKETDELHLDIKKLGLNTQLLSKMLKTGIPSGLQSILFALSNLIVQSSINSFGSKAMAGSASELNYELFSYYVVLAFNMATTSFTSQNLGAQKFERCRKVNSLCILFGIIFTGIMDFIFVFFREFFIQIYTTDPEAIKFGVLRMLVVVSFQWLVATYEISGATIRAAGHPMIPAALSILFICVFRVFWVKRIFPFSEFIPVLKAFSKWTSLLAVYPLSWIMTGIAMIAAYILIAKKTYN